MSKTEEHVIGVTLNSQHIIENVRVSDEEYWILKNGSELSKSSVLTLVCGRAKEQYMNRIAKEVDEDLLKYRLMQLCKQET